VGRFLKFAKKVPKICPPGRCAALRKCPIVS
jgi:hypothetical protein